MDTTNSPSNSEPSRPDPPSTAPLYERIFGKDPTAAKDPILYHIPDIRHDMTYEEKRDILQVAQWPESDLRDLIAGDPPDADFSNAKPANQVNFSTFQTYIEPYIRPFTEEDVAFLKERGDRVTPYVMPQRGAKTYKQVWSSEDSDPGIEPPAKHQNDPNEPRGSMEEMNENLAESDTISMGPIMSRLLSCLRPQPTPTRRNDDDDGNGDISMTNGDDDASVPPSNPNAEEQRPAASLPPEAPKPDHLPSLDYHSLEHRAVQELQYLGFFDEPDEPKFGHHNDDEVAARLRTLQHELRRVSRLNNVRRARVLELTEERMAMQEYSNIADDLDNQVNAAYLKRNRSLGKPNQKKGNSHNSRPGQKGVASAPAGRGVSDGVRALMQKRRDWIDMVGPVVGYGRPPIPGDDETIFDEANLKRLEKMEREAEMGEVEGE
jgi:transcriptional adapter 3